MSWNNYQSKPEMVQLDNSEYIFDENGGRGTPASTFFKRLASFKGESDPAQKAKQTADGDPKIIGAAYSHADALRMEQLSLSTNSLPDTLDPHHSKIRRKNHFDIDDDWDANVEHDLVQTKSVQRSIENVAEGRDTSRSASSHLSNSNSRNSTSSLSRHSTSKDLYSNSTSTTQNGLKVQYEKIIKDPSNSLNAVSLTPQTSPGEPDTSSNRLSRISKFKKLLHASNVDINDLKKLAWSGIPYELRPMSWQLLLGYIPPNAERRVATLARKRKEYMDGVSQVFGSGLDQTMWHQISIDVPRTNPHIKLYGFYATQRALERILYLWAIRHPASGYVQGINDLATPFFQTFLSAYIEGDPETYDPGDLPKEVLDVIEADTYWCLTKLLDGIQDNYIHAQPGIQRQVAELKDLTQRIDNKLAKHLVEESVEFMQFSFRWMNCLLMREVSVKNTVRMWDTYMAEGADGFSEFHVYVCAAFLVKWSAQLLEMDFQEIMMFLQALPTKDWGEKDIELLLSEAFMWQSLFKNAAAHLR